MFTDFRHDGGSENQKRKCLQKDPSYAYSQGIIQISSDRKNQNRASQGVAILRALGAQVQSLGQEGRRQSSGVLGGIVGVPRDYPEISRIRN